LSLDCLDKPAAVSSIGAGTKTTKPRAVQTTKFIAQLKEIATIKSCQTRGRGKSAKQIVICQACSGVAVFDSSANLGSSIRNGFRLDSVCQGGPLSFGRWILGGGQKNRKLRSDAFLTCHGDPAVMSFNDRFHDK
jgi:hypothetical protein